MKTESVAAHGQTVQAVLAALEVNPHRGLSETEVRARLKKYGRNELATKRPIPAWRKFLAQFSDVLVILLIIAALISVGIWWVERATVWPYGARRRAATCAGCGPCAR